MSSELRRGNNQVALLDPDDRDDVAGLRWRYRPRRDGKPGYVMRWIYSDGKRRISYLQNEIMQPPEGHKVIFLNFNRLDYRRSNLRVVTIQQARRHRLKRGPRMYPKGFKYDRRQKCWIVDLQRNGVRDRLGPFCCLAEAIMAHDRATKEKEIHPRSLQD